MNRASEMIRWYWTLSVYWSSATFVRFMPNLNAWLPVTYETDARAALVSA